jgi:transposase
MKALVVTAPVELRAKLRDMSASFLVACCVRWRHGYMETPTTAAKYALWSLARRQAQLTREIEALDAELARLTAAFAPALTESSGIGPDTAAAILITASSNPERLKSEAAFAALCGVSPLPASSGKTNCHRLNRGGDRQANAAARAVTAIRLALDLDHHTVDYVYAYGAHSIASPAHGAYSFVFKNNQISRFHASFF